MNQLHQMQIVFVPVQDRLMFRLSTRGRPVQEFRFWFTRRYVRLLWDMLLKMLNKLEPSEEEEPSEIPAASPAQGEAKQLVKAAKLAVEHKEVIAKADFKTAYQEQSQDFPLGSDPILAVKVALKPGPNGKQILCVYPEEGNGLELGLNKELLHSFCQLLVNATQKAEWDLKLDFGEAKELISKRMLN